MPPAAESWSQNLPMAANGGGEQSLSRGAIVKIYLKDFLTYNEVEFVPGPSLNLILGPNGTGKSTIVSAICLGLNGKPSTLTKNARQIGEFVRHGASKALIQIELHNDRGPNIIISREITTDNRSTWKLQGETETQKTIEEVIKKLKIQVENLCQFLPQEQVQNFSRMNDKELLLGTMKAAGKNEMESSFQKLIVLQSKLGTVSTNADKDEKEVDKLRNENARAEGEVKVFRERRALKLSMKDLEKKKAWIEHEDQFLVCEDVFKRFKEVKKQYEESSSRFKPLENKIAEGESLIRKSQTALTMKRENYNKDLEAANQKLYSAEQQKNKMQTLATEFNAKRNSERKRQENVHNFKQQIHSLEDDLEQAKLKARENEPLLKDINIQLRDNFAPKEEAINRKVENAKTEGKDIFNELNEQKSKLRGIEDVDRQRLSQLSDHYKDVHDAIVWLRQNRDKFRANIYEPPAIALSVHRKEMAKYVENTIANRDITAFFCEDKEDMNKFLQYLRNERRLQVSAVHSPPNPHGMTSIEEFPSRVPLPELQQFGFHAYVRDLFTAPEPMIRYFCKNNNVHNVPVGDQRSYDNLGMIRDHFSGAFNVFYGGNYAIRISKSRYSSNAITQTSDIRPSKLLGQSIDQSVADNYRANIAGLEESLGHARRALDAANQELTALKQSRESLMSRKQELTSLISSENVVNVRLNQKRHELKRCEEEAVDLVAEERSMRKECGATVRSVIAKLNEHAALIKKMLAQDKEKEALQVYIDCLRSSVVVSQRQLNDEKEQIKQLEDNKKSAEREARVAKEKLDELLKTARSLSTFNVRRMRDLPDAIKAVFETMPENLGEIEDAINSAHARVQLMASADEQVVFDYEHRLRRIEELTAKINSINTEATKLKNQMDELREEFVSSIQALVAQINTSFGHFYATMNCAGEVGLYTGEGDSQDDFANYGIKIRVKYRSQEPLIELSANHHSGGERAVATALYMLAMQELTVVPFRCVDEINQGMDPFNERRVFDLLVDTCQRTSAQYFLVTPKLLPGLNYSPFMKIHFIQNGEHVAKEWDVNKHLDAVRALRRN